MLPPARHSDFILSAATAAAAHRADAFAGAHPGPAHPAALALAGLAAAALHGLALLADAGL